MPTAGPCHVPIATSNRRTARVRSVSVTGRPAVRSPRRAPRPRPRALRRHRPARENEGTSSHTAARIATTVSDPRIATLPIPLPPDSLDCVAESRTVPLVAEINRGARAHGRTRAALHPLAQQAAPGAALVQAPGPRNFDFSTTEVCYLRPRRRRSSGCGRNASTRTAPGPRPPRAPARRPRSPGRWRHRGWR